MRRTMTAKRNAVGNRLLARLPAKDLRLMVAACDEVVLSFGEVLFEAGERLRHAHFPVQGFVSLVSPIEGHAGLEVELVGNEGMVGVPLALGVDAMPLRAVVQGTGTALRIGAGALRRNLAASMPLKRLLDRNAAVLLAQLAQSAACIRFHVLEARLARWLLMTQDRAQSGSFHLTHELLAQMLGVRRVGVTNAAGLLQKRRLIQYHRGEITVLDRAGLEAASCGCYRAALDIYTRTLG